MSEPKPLHVLLVEDSEDDASLVLRELKRGGYQPVWERVQSAKDMRSALQRGTWQLVLSDHNMPAFSSMEAFQILESAQLDIPMIIVSGSIDEDQAVAAMRMGVHDYLFKGKLGRLVPAIDRELREAAVRAERRKMQEQLLISDRMASVGTLAAGVAHEINNPLAALLINLGFVNTSLDALAKGLPGPGQPSHEALDAELSEARSSLHDALEAAHRVHQITRDLKIFSRSSREERLTPVDLKEVLESSVRMAWNEIRHRARLVKDYADIPLAAGIESRLGQVFLNLLANAAQAIPEGRCNENEIRIVTRRVPEGVAVEIRDSGSGIPDEVRERIFEPFFTTKPAGVGTGLGLAICHRIVTSLGGKLEVESRVGQGTCFRVILGTAHGAPTRSSARPPSLATPRRGKLLVIDDEPMIGAAVQRIFSGQHEVSVYASVRAALERLERDESFDVIFCDLMMPEMTGIDLHARLNRRSPELAARVVFMTGGAFTAAGQDFLSASSNLRVEKPFDVDGLKVLVNDLIANEAQGHRAVRP
jgi:signal transduction histidine kinase